MPRPRAPPCAGPVPCAAHPATSPYWVVRALAGVRFFGAMARPLFARAPSPMLLLPTGRSSGGCKTTRDQAVRNYAQPLRPRSHTPHDMRTRTLTHMHHTHMHTTQARTLRPNGARSVARACLVATPGAGTATGEQPNFSRPPPQRTLAFGPSLAARARGGAMYTLYSGSFPGCTAPPRDQMLGMHIRAERGLRAAAHACLCVLPFRVGRACGSALLDAAPPPRCATCTCNTSLFRPC